MQLKHVPTIDLKYWCALVLASVFGANTGDFFLMCCSLAICLAYLCWPRFLRWRW